MRKGKAITLLSIIGVVMALLIVMTFVSFPIPWISNGVYDYNAVIKAVDLDYDIVGGYSYELTLSGDNEEEITDINSVISTFNRRLDALGYKAYSVKAIREDDDSDYNIRIEIKENDNADSDITTVATFGEVVLYGGTADSETEITVEDDVVENAYYSGSGLSSDGTSTVYNVTVVFTTEAYEALEDSYNAYIDAGNSDYNLKIMLGEETILSGTFTLDNITNRTVYISCGTEAAARQQALQISTGGLAYLYEVGDSVTITSAYGDNVDLFLWLAFGALLVLLSAAFIIAFRGFGLCAALSLILFGIIELLLIVTIPGITVSVAGIIGVLLSTVIAADGLFMTVKRIREEYESGKTVKAAVKTGYKRALLPSIDISVIALIGGLLLFAFTGGALQSFAITLSIGAVISAVSSILFSRMFANLMLPLVKKQEAFFNLKRAEA